MTRSAVAESLSESQVERRALEQLQGFGTGSWLMSVLDGRSSKRPPTSVVML